MPVSSRSSRSAACTGVSPGSMCPCTVSHDPGERPPGARRSTSTSSPAPPDRSRYASMKRSEEHTSELQSHSDLVCRLLLEKKKKKKKKKQNKKNTKKDKHRNNKKDD